jgi:hypothetical protein
MINLLDVSVSWWEAIKAACSPSSLLQIVAELYVVVGFLIVGFIALRGMKLRRPPRNGRLWDKRDNVRNGLFAFQSIVLLWPIAFLIEVILWPLVLALVWEDRNHDDDTT